MAEWYDQLHMMANNRTKFQQNLFSGFRGVASTKCSYVVVCIKSIKSHNSCKICRIKIAAGYDQLYMVEQSYKISAKSVQWFLRSCVHKVFLWLCIKSIKSHNYTVKFVESKWRNDNNYIWWRTIIQNFSKICSVVSEELRPQSVPML